MQRIAALLLLLVPVTLKAAEPQKLAGAEGCRIVAQPQYATAKASWNGACREGFAEGRGTLEWQLGEKVLAHYEGDLKAGQMHGDGYLRLDDGTQYEGGFAEGRYQGQGTLLYIMGRYDGEFVDGCPNGKGKMVFAMGGRYDGQWQCGKFHGTGTAVYPSGRTVTTQWVDGIRADLAAAAEADPKHTLKSAMPATGSKLRWDVASGTVPFAKGYAEMSAAEKKEVNSWFRLIDDGDEPPYPLKGTKPIYEQLAQALSVIDEDSAGKLLMYVDIDAEGNPTKASVFTTPNQVMAKFAMSVVLQQKFKPGTCAGKPCATRFPFCIIFSYEP